MMTTSTADKDVLIEQYIRANQTEKAVKLLCETAIACARQKAFNKAEDYRDRLYEVDSMALSEIVKVNEAIEDEKSKAIGPGPKQLWHKFFDELSAEEVNAFFMALIHQDFESDQVILQQGKTNDRLFLVNKGRLKVVHENEEKEQLICQLESGSVFGDDTFFSVNVCTASVVALTNCRVSYFYRSQLDKLRSKHPFLGSNLEKTCKAGQSLFDHIRKKGIDRRVFKRINLQAKSLVQVLTSNAQNVLPRPIAAELWDISKNGLSFYIQSKNRESVRRLIGRNLGVTIQITVGGVRKQVTVTGVVHGVQNHPLDEYSIHLKLNREFSHKALQSLHHLAAMQ
jgi:CRP-like cAMP-binding protein